MKASDTDLRTRIPWFLFTVLLCLLFAVPEAAVPEAVAQSRGSRGSTSTEGGRTERSSPERSEGSRAEQPRTAPRTEQPRATPRTESRGETRAEPSRTEPSRQSPAREEARSGSSGRTRTGSERSSRGAQGPVLNDQRGDEAAPTTGRGTSRGTGSRTSRGSSRDDDRSGRGTVTTRDREDARTSRSTRGQTRSGAVGSRGSTSRTGGNDGWRSDRRTDVRWRSDRFRPVQRRVYIPPRRTYRPYYHRPGVHIHIDWPWMHRYHRGWAPRYLYRQVVYVESGWASRRYDSRLDVRTYYRHRVLDASWDRAEVDIEIDRIELYRDGRFLGAVERIPNDLERIRAVVYRNGDVRFDRDVFIVGDPRTGFEMISTRHYDGFVIDAYHRSHGYRAGALDLRRERVVPVRYSRLFDPYDFNGFVPISLLPEDTGWLVDAGYESPSGYYWGDDEDYYYGRGNDGGYNYGTDPYGDSYGNGSGYDDRYDDDRYDDDRYDDDRYDDDRYDDDRYDDRSSPSMQVRPDAPPPAPGADLEPFRDEQEHQYRTERGNADIRLKRETELKRIE